MSNDLIEEESIVEEEDSNIHFGMGRLIFRVFFFGVLLVLIPGALMLRHHLFAEYDVLNLTDAEILVVQKMANQRNGELKNINKKKVTKEGDKRFLFGGEDIEERFDITEFRLDINYLQYGLGREYFPALISPEFISASDADVWLNPTDPVLLGRNGSSAKVYPVGLMQKHEVVNDVLGGEPVFVAYCILANLGAIYKRSYDDFTYTFAVSGYTYRDSEIWKGRSAFVLWDRETESLWWPPIGKAVSGSSIDMPMQVLDRSQWAQTTWGEARSQYPDALVLARNQNQLPPESWPELAAPHIQVATGDSSEESIAPRWGVNGIVE